jgi:hypothetical protein
MCITCDAVDRKLWDWAEQDLSQSIFQLTAGVYRPEAAPVSSLHFALSDDGYGACNGR